MFVSAHMQSVPDEDKMAMALIRTTCISENLGAHFKVKMGISGTCKIECIQSVLYPLWPTMVYVYTFSAYLLTVLAMSLKVSIICNVKCVSYLESHVMYTNTYKIHMYLWVSSE